MNDSDAPGWDRITQVSEQLRYVPDRRNASGVAFYGYEELTSGNEAAALSAAEIKVWKNENNSDQELVN